MTPAFPAYDVVVVGGGAGGLGAAVGAARAGAKTLLIERRAYLGGASTASSVLTFCGFYTQGESPLKVVAGVGDEVLDRLGKRGLDTAPFFTRTRNSVILLEPEPTKIVFDEMVRDYDIDVLLHCYVVDAATIDGKITSLICAEDNGNFEINAKAFVDASGNANLAAVAGASFEELSAEERQRGSLAIRFGGVNRTTGTHANRSLLNELASAVENANLNRPLPLPLPHGFVGKMPFSDDILAIVIDLEVDALSSLSLTKAELSARQFAWDYLDIFRRNIPSFQNAFLSATGPEIGIRQGRKVRTISPATGEDARSGSAREKVLARAGWPMEFHRHDGTIVYEEIGGPGWFGIGYGALAADGIDNLWMAGRAIGAERDAYASIRVMGTAFATGQAAGVSAATWTRTLVHNPDKVQSVLEEQGAGLLAN